MGLEHLKRFISSKRPSTGALRAVPGARLNRPLAAGPRAFAPLVFAPCLFFGQLEATDPIDLLDARDPWLRTWAEEVLERANLEDLTGEVLDRALRASRVPNRREAVVLEVSASLSKRRREDDRHLSRGLFFSLRVDWRVLFEGRPSEALMLPRQERKRRRRCALLEAPSDDVLQARARAARLEALGCDETEGGA